MTKDHFATLELKPGADENDVKKAYRNLAKKFHPDKNNDSGAEEKFKEISAAYEFLKSDDRRQILERDLKKKFETSTSASSYTQYSKSKSGDNTSSNYDSDWSRKFGHNSENIYKNSTFGHFAEETTNPGTNHAKAKKEKKSKPKQQKKQTSYKSRRQWSNDWTTGDDGDYFETASPSPPPPPRANFSYAFKSFVDDLGTSFDAFFNVGNPMQFNDFTSYFDLPDQFQDFYKQGLYNSCNMDGMSQSPRRPRPRNVAPENGASGLNPEYLFTSPNSYGNKENSYLHMDVGPRKSDFDDDDMDSQLFKCTYCAKRMPFSQLSTHEPGCALRHGGKFDGDSEDDADSYIYDDDYHDGLGRAGHFSHNTTGDWRKIHNDLIHDIRRARRDAKSGYRRYNSATPTGTATSTSRENKDEGIAQVLCKWCGRSFSHPAAKHHIPFCEKWTKDHGTPLNSTSTTKGSTDYSASKNQKAKEYARNIPRPQTAREGRSMTPPTSPHSSFDTYPNVGVHSKRETMNKPGAASGTGLHSTYKGPRVERMSPDIGASGSGTAYIPRSKPQMKHSPVYKSHRAPTTTHFNDTNPPFHDSYGFELNGTRLKTEARARGADTCFVCKRKYGNIGRCLCNTRKTGS